MTMKLYYSPTSPYARKARIALRERGLESRIAEIAIDPFAPTPPHGNPLGKVPTLVLEHGAAIFDSPVICAYLLALDNPRAAVFDLDQQRQQALADGMLDAAFAIVMERRRPTPQQSPEWLARWALAIDNALDFAEAQSDWWTDRFDLGAITGACALGYLDFRLPEIAWRTNHPALATWFETASARRSVIDTAPPA